MEIRSYRGVVYDDEFRFRVVCLSTTFGVSLAAKVADVSTGSVYRWEQEFLGISASTMERIAEAIMRKGFRI